MNIALNIAAPRYNRIAVSVFFFIAGITFASWACRIPDIKNQLHLSDAGLGSVLFALPVGLMVSLPLSGWTVGKFGSRSVLLIGALLYPLILVLLSFATSTLQLVVGLFFFGLFANLFNISVNTQAVGVEANYGRSIMASFHGVWSLAGFTGALIGTFMVSQQLSTTAHFSIVCGLTLVLVLGFFRHTLRQDFGDKNQPIFVRPDKSLLMLGLIAFGCMVCEGTMFDWSGVYFQKVVEVPKEYTTLGYTAFMSTMAGGRFIGDWLATRLGTKRMIQMSGIIIAAGLILAVIYPSMIVATIGFLLVGMGVSSVVPLVYSAAGKSGTMSPGASLAAVSTIGFIGFLLGPPTIGFIAEAANLRWSFTLIALLGFSTTVLATKVKFK
jgi:MFS family permease